MGIRVRNWEVLHCMIFTLRGISISCARNFFRSLGALANSAAFFMPDLELFPLPGFARPSLSSRPDNRRFMRLLLYTLLCVRKVIGVIVEELELI